MSDSLTINVYKQIHASMSQIVTNAMYRYYALVDMVTDMYIPDLSVYSMNI